MQTSTQEHLEVVNQLESEVHSNRDEQILAGFRAEAGVKMGSAATSSLSEAPSHIEVDGALVETPAFQAEIDAGHDVGSANIRPRA